MNNGCTTSDDSHQTCKTSSKASLEPYVAKLERFELFSTNQCYYLVGCNKQNTAYRVLKMDRTMIERSTDAERVHISINGLGNDRSTIDGLHNGGVVGNSDAPATHLADNSHTAKPTLRPLSDFLIEDPNTYSQEEIKEMLEMIHDGNRVTRIDGKPDVQINGGLNPIVKAFGIVGFVRFLDCYYLTLTTRRAKVGSIGDNAIYTIKNTETIPLKPAERRRGADDGADPSSVLLSMWNRGKRSVGLGLSNREIAELRYQGLYQVVDLTKNFYFSYTYDITRSLQENFLVTSTRPLPPPPFKDMYSWNFFLTREFESCLNNATSYQWIMPIIHGAFDQRKVNDYGRYLTVTLLARRSRHFAGTRYLKRGVSEQGKVANDVEYEQILHDETLSPPGTFSSFIQVRGSIPTFWTQESSVTIPKPPIELNRVDPMYTATQLHFADLLRRYSSPILVLDLVKQSEKREREVRVGNEFRHAIDYVNHSIDKEHKIRYCALDYSHISKHRNLDVSYALNEVATWAVNQTGFFCSAPRWKINAGGVVVPFTTDDGCDAHKNEVEPVFPMEQSGVLRTNCIDCLDRTNVAQFSAGVEAIGHQLVVMGIRSQGKLGPSSSFVRVLIDLYVDIGDSIALQYGGSEAHKKVTASVNESIAGPIGKHKELLTSIRRYYSNAFTDRLKQDSMNLFLGYYLPYRHSVPLWEMENDYYLHNFHVLNTRNATSLMKIHERAFGMNSVEDEEEESPKKSILPDHGFSTSSNTRDSTEERRHAIMRQESKRVARVRRRCNKQNIVLSSWWKLALQANLEERMLLRYGRTQEENTLPGRFERIYQPEKLTQFDRVFSRAWETPVRRTHAAQHSEGVDGDDARDLTRIFSVDPYSPKVNNKPFVGELNSQQISLCDFVSDYNFQSVRESNLKLFAEFFDKFEVNDATTSQVECTQATIVPENYREYCDASSQTFHPYKPRQINEFHDALHDLSLSVDDVAGINELCRSSHLGEIISSGEYRGFHKDVSAVQVATALHEQFNYLESQTELQCDDREFSRKGFETDGIKESVRLGCSRLSSAKMQYTEVLEPEGTVYQRSGLSTANSLKLYASNFDKEIVLTTSDRIFLDAYNHPNSTGFQSTNTDNSAILAASSFVEKASCLGFVITPHAQRLGQILPPLYQAYRKQSVSAEFEQINEDMFSRKENKFMVFNGAGVDSWTGTQSITKSFPSCTIGDNAS